MSQLGLLGMEATDVELKESNRNLTRQQREIVMSDPAGACKVIGGAGTGKTLIAMHRARILAETGNTVLLTSFAKSLSEATSDWLDANCSEDARARITVQHVHSIVVSRVLNPLARLTGEPWLKLVGDRDLAKRLRRRFDDAACELPWELIRSEWRDVILPRSIRTLEEYRGASRRGLGRHMGSRQEEQAWRVFGAIFEEMATRGEADYRMACRVARERLGELRVPLNFGAVLVDEYQDFHLEELRFVAAVAARPSGLMLLGDSGQRVFAPPVSLVEAGIEIGGRTRSLKTCYRSTREIITSAEFVLGRIGAEPDPDGVVRESPTAPVPGTPIRFICCSDSDQELDALRAAIMESREKGPLSVGVLCLTNARRIALEDCLRRDGMLSESGTRVLTMHDSKGQEFDAVILPGMGDGEFPDPEWLVDEEAARVIGNGDLHRILHVAMSRPRRRLFIIYSGTLSTAVGSALTTLEQQRVTAPAN